MLKAELIGSSNRFECGSKEKVFMGREIHNYMLTFELLLCIIKLELYKSSPN